MLTVLQFVLFVFLCLLIFTLPGIYFLQSKLLNSWDKITIGSVIGFVLFTLCAYFLGILGISILLFPLVAVFNVLALKNILHKKLKLPLLTRGKLLILSLIFIIGIAGQMAIIGPSGTYRGEDLVFYSSNGHDGAWHIALMEEIKKGYPLQNPAYAGERLVNYHFFSDIAPSVFSQYFRLSNLDLYFRFFPFLFSILLGSTAYLLGKKVGGSDISGIWSAFFVYFVGSFGYIITWLQNRVIAGESIFWATQIQSSIGNPPQIISDILVLTFLYLFFNYLFKKDFYLFALCILLAGIMAVFKVYAGIVILASLGLVGLVQLIKERKINIFSMFVLSSIFGSILYLPNTAKSASFLIWEPWWFIRTMIVSRLNWLDLELKRQTFVAEGNWKRVLQIESIGFLIFLFGNLGMRFLGLLSFYSLLKNFNNYFNQLLLFLIFSSFILPLLFLQRGVAGNTIQFLQYFLLLFGILAALTITRFQKKIKSRVFKIAFILLIIVFSIPTQVGLIYDFYHRPPIAKITSDELDALEYLKENTNEDNIIITPPYNKFINQQESTPNIWAWFDTSYVAAFSARRTYLADSEQVDIMGYDLKRRVDIANNIFSTIDNAENLREVLKINKIDYIYFPKSLKPKLDLGKTDFLKLFDNGSVEIWRVI